MTVRRAAGVARIPQRFEMLNNPVSIDIVHHPTQFAARKRDSRGNDVVRTVALKVP
jgi:hypothetical protein